MADTSADTGCPLATDPREFTEAHFVTVDRPALATVLTPLPDVPRTSLSHPLRIDEVVVAHTAGRIGLCICPGKRGHSLKGARWQRDLAMDLAVVQHWRPNAVLTLLEAHEFDLLGVTQLGPQLQARGIEWHHLPIVDMQPPDARFEAGWRRAGPLVRRYLGQGGRVLVHCRGGLGRTGSVAARLLVELGTPAHEAIARVRQARPGAIETLEQARHVLDLPQPGVR